MKNKRGEKGQTVIETALVMILLLVLFFGIAEIARAWWLKNQINNAARVAVRVAIVTPGLSNISPVSCSSSNNIVTAACNSITNTELHNRPTTTIGLTITDSGNGTVPDSGDTVKVTVTGEFRSVVPNLASLSFGLFPSSLTMSSDASMRYE